MFFLKRSVLSKKSMIAQKPHQRWMVLMRAARFATLTLPKTEGGAKRDSGTQARVNK